MSVYIVYSKWQQLSTLQKYDYRIHIPYTFYYNNIDKIYYRYISCDFCFADNIKMLDKDLFSYNIQNWRLFF
jgi:hypothetical protein